MQHKNINIGDLVKPIDELVKLQFVGAIGIIIKTENEKHYITIKWPNSNLISYGWSPGYLEIIS